MMEKEKDILRNYIGAKKLKFTQQRERILEAFLKMEKHVSAEELYMSISKNNPEIGLATVYRTLNLLCECGLAQEKNFGTGETRFEHIFNHRHHDHLICVKCGEIIEFENLLIEKLQDEVAAEKKFEVKSHNLEIYGICYNCRRKGEKS
jgi:Fur family ferric uptake transcriptional regulator